MPGESNRGNRGPRKGRLRGRWGPGRYLRDQLVDAGVGVEDMEKFILVLFWTSPPTAFGPLVATPRLL